MTEIVWGLFIAKGNHEFPNFYPIGFYSAREKAIEEIVSLPKHYHYQMFEIPIDKFFGYLDKKGNVKSGVGMLRHEHFIEDEDI
jgi:hypothetical protein